MQIIDPYRGNYVSAESASKYIDINTIVSGCQRLAGASSGFSDVSRKVYSAGDMCNEKALSIDGDTLVDYIIEQADSINEYSSRIANMAENVMNRACEAYNRLQNNLNNNAYQQECDYVNKLNSKK